MKVSAYNLIWLDLEMTGLDPVNDRIIEIATVITDKFLNVLAEGPVLAIHHSPRILARMDSWNVKQHVGSGLVERVQKSCITTGKAESLTIAFLEKYVPAGKSPMCGNTICQDRRFLYRRMPRLEKYFNYRNLDVTSLKIIAQQWYPEKAKVFQKKSKHKALDDIYDSIAELKFYQEYILQPLSR
jgi:oligoribonuclease